MHLSTKVSILSYCLVVKMTWSVRLGFSIQLKEKINISAINSHKDHAQIKLLNKILL